MQESVKKAIKTGYGLGLLSMKEAQKVAGVVRKELNLNEEESLKLAKELVKNSQKASEDVLATATKYFDNALLKTGLVSKNELSYAKKTLKKRINKRFGAVKAKEESILQKVKGRFKRK